MNSDRLTYVGHSTVLLEMGGTRLLTDPLLRNRIGPLVRHGAPPATGITADLDALLISHLHRDHADIASLRKLSREVPVLAPPGSHAFFEQQGFTLVTELTPGESTKAGELTVTAVEARHDVGKRRHAHSSEAIGFLVLGAGSVYFAGDTDIFAGMDRLAPDLDLALLPIWGWGPNVGDGHLNPRRAAEAAALLAPRIAVPIHWGTLYPAGLSRLRPGPLRLPGREFTQAMRELAPQVATRVLSPGEATSLA
jgi:L-ascorbate metabolism protein UlaG (beta-lactamase superfamily)